MGLHISVYRNAEFGDCTNGGISSKYNKLCVVNVDGPFNPTADSPAVLLAHGAMPGIARIVPAVMQDNGTWKEDPRWLMMGGNYGSTSDSRFVRAVEAIVGHRFYGAVAIHDRHEG